MSATQSPVPQELLRVVAVDARRDSTRARSCRAWLHAVSAELGCPMTGWAPELALATSLMDSPEPLRPIEPLALGHESKTPQNSGRPSGQAPVEAQLAL